jgi:hypothetical protein
MTRVIYVLAFIVVMAVGVFVAHQGWASHWTVFTAFKDLGATSDANYYLLACFSLALFVYHFVIGIISSPAGSAHAGTIFKYFHRTWFSLKHVLLAVFILVTFTCQRETLDDYAVLAGALQFFTILYQFIVLVEMTYRLNNVLFESGLTSVLLILSVALYAGTLFLHGTTIYNYAVAPTPDTLDGLTSAIVLPVIVLILSIAAFALCFLIETATIFPTAFVAFLGAVYTASGVQSVAEQAGMTLVPFLGSFIAWASFLLSFVTLCFLCTSGVSLGPLFAKSALGPSDIRGYESEDCDVDLDNPDTSYHYGQFHFAVAVLAAAIVPMIAGTSSVSTEAVNVVKMKIWTGAGGAMIGSVLFLWTLVAPALFPDREF